VVLGRELGITATGRFGAALAAGDFDRNGATDLAIGAPGGRGVVVGLVNAELGDLAQHLRTWSFSEVASDSGFGTSLVAGDFDCDGYDDLAVGAPRDGQRAVRPGAVRVLYGQAVAGVTTAGSVRFPATNTTFAHGSLFGAALTRGDCDGDARDDLVIGVPGEGAASGAVHIYRGVAGAGPSAASMVRRVQPGAESEAGDAFGETLTTGDFDGDGFDDLAVGVPGEAVGALVAAGAIRLYRGGAGASMLATPYTLTQDAGRRQHRDGRGSRPLRGWAPALRRSARRAGDGRPGLGRGGRPGGSVGRCAPPSSPPHQVPVHVPNVDVPRLHPGGSRGGSLNPPPGTRVAPGGSLNPPPGTRVAPGGIAEPPSWHPGGSGGDR
jgi:hypothetical protein